MMGGLDASAIGLLLGALGGVFSFWLGRRWRAKRVERKREKAQAVARANESRQVRRARERRESGG